MTNFGELLSEMLNEKDKSFKNLEDAGIIKKRTHYQYKTFMPFLPTILSIANFLEVSLDYMVGRTTKNNFKKYNVNEPLFYEHLIRILKKLSITQKKFTEDLSIGRSNLFYWKNGSLPKLPLLIEIANYLGCDIDELLEREK